MSDKPPGANDLDNFGEQWWTQTARAERKATLQAIPDEPIHAAVAGIEDFELIRTAAYNLLATETRVDHEVGTRDLILIVGSQAERNPEKITTFLSQTGIGVRQAYYIGRYLEDPQTPHSTLDELGDLNLESNIFDFNSAELHDAVLAHSNNLLDVHSTPENVYDSLATDRAVWVIEALATLEEEFPELKGRIVVVTYPDLRIDQTEANLRSSMLTEITRTKGGFKRALPQFQQMIELKMINTIQRVNSALSSYQEAQQSQTTLKDPNHILLTLDEVSPNITSGILNQERTTYEVGSSLPTVEPADLLSTYLVEQHQGEIRAIDIDALIQQSAGLMELYLARTYAYDIIRLKAKQALDQELVEFSKVKFDQWFAEWVETIDFAEIIPELKKQKGGRAFRNKGVNLNNIADDNFIRFIAD